MCLFAKPEFKEVESSFYYVDTEKLMGTVDEEGPCLIDLEAKVELDGKVYYPNVSLGLKLSSPDYRDDLVNIIENEAFEKKIKIKFKIVKGKVKDARFDVESLSKIFNDERFNNLEELAWGCNEKSIEQITKEGE